jgi:hypothetical protein
VFRVRRHSGHQSKWGAIPPYPPEKGEEDLISDSDGFCLVPEIHGFLRFPTVLVVGGCIAGRRNALLMRDRGRDRVLIDPGVCVNVPLSPRWGSPAIAQLGCIP